MLLHKENSDIRIIAASVRQNKLYITFVVTVDASQLLGVRMQFVLRAAPDEGRWNQMLLSPCIELIYRTTRLSARASSCLHS